MEERQRIKQAIEAQENLRGTMDDAIIDEAVAILREKLADLERPEQQRKLATILFVDIVGSTNIVKHLDPEDALEIMDGSLKRMAIPVEQHGGHIARFMGDGFKAVFGVPVAHENDPEMAVRAGLGILEVTQKLSRELETRWCIQDFTVRVGINTGLVAIVGETEGEDTIMGEAVNIAKRVESAAPPGGLLITHNTYLHVRGVFEVEQREPIKAKGFDEPIQVYLVLGIKPRAFRVRVRGVEGVETRLVGREAELITLQNAFRDAVEGQQTQVVTVVGEAGVGKSRLLDEFQDWLDLLSKEVRFFQGRGRQESQYLPYALLKDMFAFRFQIQESDSAGEVRKRIDCGFGEIYGIDDEGKMRAHITGQLLGFDFSDSPHVKGILDDPQQIHDRALMYLTEYFQGMSEQASAVIFLEDIHWADDSSLDIVNQLARILKEQSLLIICLARHRLFDRRPFWGEGLIYHRRLELEPLSRHESGQLVAEILHKVEHVPKRLQELVVMGAEGNPFYIEELVKMLVENGVIITGEERWLVEPDRLAEVEVPDTLTGVLQARLEGLPQDERNTLQQASVVGHIFWDDTVEYITNESSSTDAQSALRSTDVNLTSLRSRELIYHHEESAFSEAAEYTFKHAVLRDVTYESVLKRLRKTYHGLVAEWLIRHSEDRIGEYTGLIADHLEMAGKHEQAAIYLYQAGEGAAKRYAHVEAARYFSRALTLTPEADLICLYDLLIAREKILDIQGERDPQLEDLSKLMEIAAEIGDVNRQAEVMLRQINYYVETGNYSAVEEMMSSTSELIHSTGDAEYEANLLLYWGRSSWKRGKSKNAQSTLKKALKLAHAHELHQLETEVLRNLGVAYDQLGEFDQAISYTEKAMIKCRKLGDRRGEAAAINNLASFNYVYQSEFFTAVTFYKQSYQLCHEIGDRSGEGTAAGNIGSLCVDQYNYDEAREYLFKGLEVSHEVENYWLVGYALVFLGYCDLYQGDYEGAKDYFDQALEITRTTGMRYGEAIVFGKLMEVFWCLGDYKCAESCRIKHADMMGMREDIYAEARQLIIMSMLKLHMGDLNAALEYSRQSLELIHGYEKHELRLNALISHGHIFTASGEYEEAEKDFREAVMLGMKTYRPRQAMEALAGWAQVSVARGNMNLAFSQVEKILTFLETERPSTGNPFDGTMEPFRIYLTCYRVLKAYSDPRANTILAEAYKLLQTRAANINDEHLRDCFLNTVAVNREIVEEYEKNRLGALET
jgi:class 3 adenylate cyclase/tetratricopeptide (TPR) repeat protein